MKKFSRFFFGFAAAALIASCSSDEPGMNNPGNEPEGDGLYMKVQIRNAKSSLGKGTDGGYLFGDENEHKIADARFFFFDGSGRFLVEANLKGLGGADGQNKPTGNVEWIAEEAIVLQGLKDDELPEYMITVLNAPADFKPGVTMTETARKTCDLQDASKNFVMSTSSYFNGETNRHDNTYYYATKLEKNDFFKTKAQAEEVESGKAVVVYVERLAAKFTVAGLDEGFKEVKVTVAGNINDNVAEGNTPAAGTKLFVKFDKWGVTNTEKTSYLSKNLTAGSPWSFSATNTTINGWDWNVPGDFRSYWGASKSYGEATPDLNVLTHANTVAAITDAVYANETTNSKDNVSKGEGEVKTININNVTCALLTATVYGEFTEEGSTEKVKKPIDLVLYRGIYYTYPQFKNYVLQVVNDKTPLNFYVCENPEAPSTETKKYHQVGADDMVFYKREGEKKTAVVELKYKSDDATLYAKSVVDGKETFTAITNGVTNLNNALGTFFEAGEGQPRTEAIAYEGGKMFYTVPIEHLVAKTSAKPYAVDFEGNYGTVRNHWYRLTVNSVMKLGHGIFNPGDGEVPGEPLIPEDPDDERFNLGAEINVLSWKIVNQNVDL